jgi:hypothetical protein
MRKLVPAIVLGSVLLSTTANAQLVAPITVDVPPVTVPQVPRVDIPPIVTPPVDVPVIDLPSTPGVNVPPIVNIPPVSTPVGTTPPITVGGDNIIDIPSTGIVTPGTPIDLGTIDGVLGGVVTLPGGSVIQPILDSAGNAIGAVDNTTGQILPVRPDGTVLNPQGQPIGDINNASNANGGNSSGTASNVAGSNPTNVRVDSRNYNFSIPQAPLGYEEVTTTNAEGITTTRKGSVTTLSITGGSIAGEFVFLGQVAIPLK